MEGLGAGGRNPTGFLTCIQGAEQEQASKSAPCSQPESGGIRYTLVPPTPSPAGNQMPSGGSSEKRPPPHKSKLGSTPCSETTLQ